LPRFFYNEKIFYTFNINNQSLLLYKCILTGFQKTKLMKYLSLILLLFISSNKSFGQFPSPTYTISYTLNDTVTCTVHWPSSFFLPNSYHWAQGTSPLSHYSNSIEIFPSTPGYSGWEDSNLNVFLSPGTSICVCSSDTLSSPPIVFQHTFCFTMPDCSNNHAQFTTNGSYPTATFTNTSSSPAIGQACSYYWDFGDGNNSTSQSPNHTYAATGTYNVKLVTTWLDSATNTPQCRDSVIQSTPIAICSPAIIVQPVNSSICSGGNTSLSLTASGPSLTYQWQVYFGSSFANIGNVGVYNGTTTPILTITGATTAMNGYQYRCIVSGNCAPVAVSHTDTLNVSALPSTPTSSIDLPNHSITVCQNGIVFVQGSSTGFVNFFWSGISSGNCYGVNEPFQNLSIPNAVFCDTGMYLLYTSITYFVQNVNLTCYSHPDTVYVHIVPLPPNPDTATSNSPVCSNDSLYLHAGNVSALCSTCYEWFDSSAFGIDSIYMGQNAHIPAFSQYYVPTSTYLVYSVAAANGVSCRSQSFRTLHVTVNAIPLNLSATSNSPVCLGDTLRVSAIDMQSNVTYKWAPWNVDTSYHSSLVPYCCVNHLDTVTTQTLTVNAALMIDTGIYEVWAVQNGCLSDSPAFTHVIINPTQLFIAQQPASATLCSGANGQIFVQSNNTGFSTQWYRNGNLISYNSHYSHNSSVYADTLHLTNIDTSMTGTYTCIVTGLCSPISDTSTGTVVTLGLPSINVQAHNDTICYNDNAGFRISASGLGLTYQWQLNSGTGFANISNSSPYSGTTTDSLTITNADTSMNGYIYRCIVSGTCSPPDTSSSVSLMVVKVPNIAFAYNLVGTATLQVNNIVSFGYYRWTLNGVVIPGINGVTFTVPNTGCYNFIEYPASNASCAGVAACVNLPDCNNDTASFSSSINYLSATFTNNSSSPASWQSLSYSWNFGDGTTDTSGNPVHTYAASGIDTVTLISYWMDSATNSPQCADTARQVVQVGNDISGAIIIDTSSTNPANPTFTVWLIVYDSSTQILAAVDSQNISGTNFVAYYNFADKPAADYIVKAAITNGPSSGIGPVPTYSYDSLHWIGADHIYYSGSGASTNHNIIMQQDSVTSGPGFIAGNVNAGANKGLKSTGTPVGNLLILLENVNGLFLTHTYTDANGNYSFSNIPVGTYIVYPEEMNYATQPWTSVYIRNAHPSVNNMDFQAHTISKTITPVTTGIENISTENNVIIYPNPTRDIINIALGQTPAANTRVIISDVVGHKVLETQVLNTYTQINLTGLASGVYFINIRSENVNYTDRIVIQR